MKALILTAGYGRRMRPLTDDNHKTLLPIGNNLIINRILDSCIECDVTEFVIVTGYMAKELKVHILKNYSRYSFEFIHNEVYAETNNIYSLALAFEEIVIDQDILLIESDLIFEPQILSNLINNPYPNVALLDKYGTGMDGTVVTLDGDRIVNIIPPHLQDANFSFADKYKTLNIYKFSQEFSASAFKKLLTYYAKVIDDNCYYELILGILIYMQKELIHAELVDGLLWAEVDDPNDLRIAEFVFEEEKQKDILQSSFGGYWNYDMLDFCFIRNMYFPNGAALSELKNNMTECLYNYGSRQDILNQKLAYFLLCDKNNVQVLNGASQVYPMLNILFKGKSAIIPHQTFGEYYKIFDKYDTYSDLSDDYSLDFMQEQSHDILLFVNPNNPSGAFLPSKDIYDFARSNPNKLVIVDESFIEFTGEKSIIEILEDTFLENILVIKSLSKSLGLPGLRLGYVYTYNANILKVIKGETPIWNLNSMAEYFMEIILKHRGSIEDSYKKTIVDREKFIKDLSQINLIDLVYPSGGNFVLVKLNGNNELANQICEFLLKDHKIFIKDISQKFEDDYGYLRFAVRLPWENEMLTNKLSSFKKFES